MAVAGGAGALWRSIPPSRLDGPLGRRPARKGSPGEVFAATERDELLAALGRMLAPRTARISRPTIQPDTVVEQVAGGSASHRLVIAILKEVEFVDHLLALYIEHEVRGATILEARGMAEHLSAHMSLFAGFKSAFKAVGHSRVILTLVPAERTEEVLELVQEAAGGMRTPAPASPLPSTHRR